ncbi:hypothetical protein [Archaeoglobus neptunius]|uniref:hypothetical protein n=1 Tax=Archaeoglobus neptunius TaxID=2798580 RepID=UPI0019258623|nr:hypothetical protein [Archaeoglobus neptunius]
MDLSSGSVKKYNISVVETKYGKMWKVEVRRIDRSVGVLFDHPWPLDLFNVELQPTLNRLITKDERVGRYYEKTVNLTIPIFVEYEENATKVRMSVYMESGLDSFLGLIPVAPKHDGEVYSGGRYDEFTVDSKGWLNVTGISKIYIVYK